MALFLWPGATRGEVHPDLQPALQEIEAAMQEGDDKYGRNAWKHSGKLKVGDHVRAATRHIRRWSMGEKYDRDSKRRALAHVAARAIIALQREIDDDHRAHQEALARANER